MKIFTNRITGTIVYHNFGDNDLKNDRYAKFDEKPYTVILGQETNVGNIQEFPNGYLSIYMVDGDEQPLYEQIILKNWKIEPLEIEIPQLTKKEFNNRFKKHRNEEQRYTVKLEYLFE